MLLFLRLSIKHDFWPAPEPQWLTPFYTVTLLGPLLVLLGINAENALKTLKYIAIYTGLIFLLGYYTGAQLLSTEGPGSDGIFVMYSGNLFIATFLFLIYLQQYQKGENFSYSKLYKYSWRNFLTGVLAGLFTLIFWGILMLWAGLFELIQIDFFDDLFKEEWFHYPVLALAFGFAISVIRSQTQIIDTIKNIQQMLIKYLLLVLVLVLILFVLTFPVTGLQALWDTRSGSTIILWLQALALFFANAVYQDNQDTRPYNTWLHRYVYFGIALLPIYSAVSFYGLTLRIDQYGWTVSRGWGFFIWTIFTLFSLGYLYGIIKKRDDWVNVFSWVNVRMGIVLMIALLAANTPLLDFRKISVASQLSRMEANIDQITDEDLRYFHRELGRPGHDALEQLKKTGDTDLAQRIERIQTPPVFNSGPIDEDEFASLITALPDGKTVPDDLIDQIFSLNPWRYVGNGETELVIVANFDDDPDDEYLYISNQSGYSQGTLFKQIGGNWVSFRASDSNNNITRAQIEKLANGELDIRPHRWKSIKIGDMIFTINNMPGNGFGDSVPLIEP